MDEERRGKEKRIGRSAWPHVVCSIVPLSRPLFPQSSLEARHTRLPGETHLPPFSQLSHPSFLQTTSLKAFCLSAPGFLLVGDRVLRRPSVSFDRRKKIDSEAHSLVRAGWKTEMPRQTKPNLAAEYVTTVLETQLSCCTRAPHQYMSFDGLI